MTKSNLKTLIASKTANRGGNSRMDNVQLTLDEDAIDAFEGTFAPQVSEILSFIDERGTCTVGELNELATCLTDEPRDIGGRWEWPNRVYTQSPKAVFKHYMKELKDAGIVRFG